MIGRFLLFLTMLSLGVSQAIAAEKPFIVCNVHGNIGSQMFQIATAISLALDHNATPLFPCYSHTDREELSNAYKAVFYKLDLSNPPRPILASYKEPRFRYDPISFKPDMSLAGSFQSEKYFKHHKDYIEELFAPHPSIIEYLQSNYGDIIADPKTVSIHVRTRFLDDPGHKVFVLNGRKYVQRAISLFPSDYQFIVFSDDINWCIATLSDLSPNMRFISGESHINSFFLQSLCKHNIISNSTFSWWAAWLNKNPSKIVVAPEDWFTKTTKGFTNIDIVPSNWLQIKNQ